MTKDDWSWKQTEPDPGMTRIPRPKDYRPKIPPKVKFEVLIRQEGKCACGCGEKLGSMDDTQFDHDPALVNREWDEWAGDTVPPANDPNYLFAKTIADHQTKTKADIKLRDKTRRLQAANAEHQAKVEHKIRGVPAADPEADQKQAKFAEIASELMGAPKPKLKSTFPSGSGSRGHFRNDGGDETADVAKIAKTARPSWPQGRKLPSSKNSALYRGVDGSLKRSADKGRPTDPTRRKPG